jgi:ethanolamine ammonia-lyase small subunit
VFVVADGLSATAAQSHAPPLLASLIPRLREAGWRLAPIIVAEQGRVALGDEIGLGLSAALAVVLLGEQPQPGTPDSLGAYLTLNPRMQCTDADRSCVSNIRPEGLGYGPAADRIFELMTESRRLGS